MSTGDASFPSTSSSASPGGHERRSGQTPSRKLKVTFLSSEWQSTEGGLSTINRELAIQLAKHQNVEVTMYLPQCSEEDVRIAGENHIKLIKAKELIGCEPTEWLLSAPENHEMDYVIGHGLILGRQVQLIQKQLPVSCKWVQVVHTSPEHLGMFKEYKNAIARAKKKHKAEIELCKLADQVVAVGPKLADEYSHYLRHCQRDQSVHELTPGIFSEFSLVKQAAEEKMTFCVLVFGRGDTEDFKLKGYDIAAKAISELKEEFYQLIFVGAPLDKEEEVAEKLCHHGIARKQLTVRSFKESREDLGNLFCEVDLCIMPSRFEGFGLAVLEALSAGLPILVGGNSGLGRALQDVPWGSSCVVNSEDPKEWAKAIEFVRKKSRNVRLKETEILRKQYAKKYSWKEQCDILVKRMSDSIFGSSDKKGKRPLHPSVTPPSKKQRHDTDTWKVGISERQAAAEKLEKTPLHQDAASAFKKQSNDTDSRKTMNLLKLLTKNQKSMSLHFAALKGEIATVETILSHGFDINATDNEGNPPLMFACGANKVNVINYLLDRGADLSLKNKLGWNSLHISSVTGRVPAIETLLSRGLDIDSRDRDDRTSLWYAALKGRRDVVNCLLQHGANPSLKDKDGRNSLHAASLGGDVIIIEKLLSYDLDLDSKDDFGVTPLFMAFREEKLKAISYLLQKGADPSVTYVNKSGNLLHSASKSGRVAVIDIFLSYGLDIDLKDSDGNTPLMIAAYEGKMEVVNFLLNRGANPSLVNNNERNALHFASTGGNVAVIEKMLSHGLEINSRDSSGLTPLMIASYGGNANVVEYLLKKGAY